MPIHLGLIAALAVETRKERKNAMRFRFDKLTSKAQALVADAQSRAGTAGNPEIKPLHLLAAMIEESDGITRPLLEKMNVDVEQLAELVASETGKLPSVTGGRQPGVAPELQKTFDAAADAADILINVTGITGTLSASDFSFV